jgi:hypothetical protein
MNVGIKEGMKLYDIVEHDNKRVIRIFTLRYSEGNYPELNRMEYEEIEV